MDQIYIDSNEYFQSLIQGIENATQTIDFEVFIFANDSVGSMFADAFMQAAKKGVTIRLLIDGVGSPYFKQDFPDLFSQENISVRIYHPLPWHVWNWKYSTEKFPLYNTVLKLFSRMNSRNHRKCCIIDSKIAWVGSLNLTTNHLSTELGGRNWRDTAVKVENIPLSALKNAYQYAWDQKLFLTKVPLPIQPDDTFLFNYTFNLRKKKHKLLYEKIKGSQKRIWIENAYFVPNPLLLTHLKKAAKRGIDVRILMPQESDVFFIPWTSSAFYLSLMKAGVKIIEYQPSMLHSKVIIIDDWCTVGSSNLNYRSFFHDLEIDYVISDGQAKNRLIENYMTLENDSKLYSLSDFKRYPFWKSVLGRIFLLFKNWL